MKDNPVAKANRELVRREVLHLHHQLHLTQLTLAPLLGITPSALDKIESGTRGAVGLVVLETLRLLSAKRRARFIKSIVPPAGVGPLFRKTGVWVEQTNLTGPAGPEGPQGPPGDVSTAQLDAAIATTANNPGGYPAWSGSFSDPPTQSEMSDFASWAEGLRATLVR